MQRKDFTAWIIVLAASALSAVVLFAYFHKTTGMWLPHVLPQVEEDSLYYLVQIREVLDGKPFLGNPYIREYADASFPGLLLPIWLAAIPGLLGLGINAVFFINALLYSVLTGVILYILCLCVGRGNRTIAVAMTILGVLSLHNLLIRPAVMQTIYPCFGLFLLTMFAVLKKPHKPHAYVALGATAVLTFYLYPYLWMVSFTAIGLLFIKMLWQHDRKAITYLILMGIAVVAACLPQIWTIVSLFQDEATHALNLRIGLVETHAVLPLTILNLKYVIFLVAGLLFLRIRRKLDAAETLLLLVGISLCIGATSNIVTGKEMDFHSHFWRLSLLLNVVAISTLLPRLRGKNDIAEKIVIGLCAAALLFTTINRTFIRSNSYRYLKTFEQSAPAQRALQEYQNVFDFFNTSAVRNQVILSNSTIGQYIPIYTANYVFYAHRAGVHIVPQDEFLTRFLTYYVDDVDEKFLKNGVDGYAGISPLHTAIYANAYGNMLEPIEIVGGAKFIEKTLTEHATIQQTYDQTLRRFNVTYVIIDHTTTDNPRLPAMTTPVMSNDRFTIYRLE